MTTSISPVSHSQPDIQSKAATQNPQTPKPAVQPASLGQDKVTLKSNQSADQDGGHD